MDVFTNTKKLKKIIIILVFLILFNFCCPKIVKAGSIGNWILIGVADLFYTIVDGLQNIINDIFIDDDIFKEGEVQYDAQKDRIDNFGGKLSISVSADNIIKGKFLLMSPNIFARVPDKISGGNIYLDYDQVNSGRSNLRATIAEWYYALRNLALVALLSILVYVAIRMILTTVSQDKAKYKMMFKDWLVALCLLFVMHYIMVGTLNMSDTITKAIGTSGGGVTSSYSTDIKNNIKNAKDYVDTDDAEVKRFIYMALPQTVIYLAVVIMNIIFIIKYVIRSITIIFLSLLAPITCITYPIDKISDGKAQAYNMWFQEFLYNVIIQPFHLLIYIVLIGSATALAEENPIYAMLCFGVMIPAEKFIKQMFGFKDKMGSPLGTFASGALAGQLLKKAFSGGGSGESKGEKVEGKSENNDSFRENKLRTKLPDADSEEGATHYIGENEKEKLSQPENNRVEENSLPDNFDPNLNEEDSASAYDDRLLQAEEEKKSEDKTDIEGEETAQLGETIENDNNTLNTKGIYSPSKKTTAVGNALHAVREHRDKKLMAKYGTKNRLKAAAKYGVRKGTKLGKKAIKGAATLTGAVAFGAFGAMFGQGEKGLMLGASLGGKLGTGINNKMTSVDRIIQEYGREAVYGAIDEDKRRQKRVDKIMHTPDAIEKASKSFSKRNNGKIASTKELNQELAERAKFKETGLTDSQIDDAMAIYKKEVLGMGEDKAFAMAVKSAEEASRYKAADFEDPKKVQFMNDRIMSEYEALGVNQDLADENVRAIIGNAAETHGIKTPALPQPSRKNEYKNNKSNIERAKATYARRNGGNGPDKQQLDHELEMGYNLRRAGISEEDREDFFNNYLMNSDAIEEARATVGEDASYEVIENELERRFEIKLKTGIEDEKQLTKDIVAAKEFIKETNNIDNPSNGQVYTEIKQRLTVRDSYHISARSVQELNNKITEIRRDEERFVKNSKDKEGARVVLNAQRVQAARQPKSDSKTMISRAQLQREFLTKYSSREMQDEQIMKKAHEKLDKELRQMDGTLSPEARKKLASEVIISGKEMVGISNNN